MKMIELLGGIVIGGVAGVALKDKLVGKQGQDTNKQNEVESLYAENEKFSRRNKELERQVEDLLSELNKVQKKIKMLTITVTILKTKLIVPEKN